MTQKLEEPSYVYVQPIYRVVGESEKSLDALYDQVIAHRHITTNKHFKKTKTGRQLLASIVRGLNSPRYVGSDNSTKPTYRITIDQGQRTLDWRKFPNVKDSQSVRLIMEPLVEMGWLQKTAGHQGYKLADKFFAPEGSPLRADWEYEKLDYKPPNVVINLYTKRDEVDGGYRSPDINKMESPRFKKLLKNHYVPQINKLSELVNSHTYNLPFTDYQFRRGFVGGLENCGGRLQANYQLLPQEKRLSDIQIDGQTVCEIDVVSCGLVLMHSLAKQQIPNVEDLYSLVGSSLPRKELKLLITAVCNKGKLAKHGWSPKWKQDKKLGPIVNKTNYRQFRSSLLLAFPWLETFLAQTTDVALKTQWLESEIIIKAMLTVLEAGHGCLSVHESLIVPKATEALAKDAMIKAFQETAHITPRLACK